MDKSLIISAARVAEEVMQDRSCVYGVDLFDAIRTGGKSWDLGGDYAHIPCDGKAAAEDLLSTITANSDVVSLEMVSRPYVF